MSETLNLNPEESLPEQNPPKPDKKNVDKGAVEREAAERDERRAKESEVDLDVGPRAGESETEIRRGDTIIEKSTPDRSKEIRKQIEEELRKNPVSLSDEDIDNISKEVLQKRQSAILENLPENVKDKYPDQAAAEQVRQKMLQNMVDNKVVSKEEEQSFCSEAAFYRFLQNGYDAENIRLAGPWETIKKAFRGVPVVQQIKVLREIATKGELLVLPKADGRKTVIPLEDFKGTVEENDSSFNMYVQGQQEYAKRKILAEREEAIILSEVVQRLEAEEKAAGRGRQTEPDNEKKQWRVVGKKLADAVDGIEGGTPLKTPEEAKAEKEPINKENIDKVSSFGELDTLLEKGGMIVGSRGKIYDSEKLKGLIRKHIDGIKKLIEAKISKKEIHKYVTEEANHLFNDIPRSSGLRDKVIELLLSMSESERKPKRKNQRDKKK